MNAALYIHIPFCKSKCLYCDFFSTPLPPENAEAKRLLDAYIEALKRDIAFQIKYFDIKRITSIYIGGGTPSLLSVGQLKNLFAFFEDALPRGEDGIKEITLEANSESINADFIAALRGSPVTRLSAGVQSFCDECRVAVGRRGSGAFIKSNLEALKDLHGIELSFDLMSGLPFQTREVLAADIRALLAYNPAHISLYDLTLEEGSSLLEIEPSPEEKDALYLFGRDALEKSGFLQYEVSNFARGGRISRHNMNYWTLGNWLGAGAGAGGTVFNDEKGTALRWTVQRDIPRYIASNEMLSLFDFEFIGNKTLLKDTLLMGFRTIYGIDDALFKNRFSRRVEEALPRTVKRWRERGFYSADKNALTKEGLLFLNRFLLDCFEEI